MLPFTEEREAPKNFWTWLNKRHNLQKKGHKDTVVVVCGGEQMGKSRWTLRTEWCLAKEEFYKEGKINVDKIVFTGEDYRYQVTHNKKSIIHDDEAITHFYSRQAMTQENVDCNQTLAQCGYRHNLQFILIPDFFVLDTYLRQHRVHAIVKIYANNKFKVWTFYKNNGQENKKKLKKILKLKSFSVTPSSKGWWTDKDDTEEFKKFVKEYRKKEDKFKTKSGEKREQAKKKPKGEKEIKLEIANRLLKNPHATKKQVAEQIGISRWTLDRWKEKEVAK